MSTPYTSTFTSSSSQSHSPSYFSSSLSPNYSQKVLGITTRTSSKTFSSIRSLKGLGDINGYCDPNDQCCAKYDPEIFFHKSKVKVQSQARKQCHPNNPFHFEYSILHRQQLKKKLQALVDQQDAGIFGTSQDQHTVNADIAEGEDIVPDKLLTFPEPDLINSEELQMSLQNLGNMALAHEIALNKDFKFSNPDRPINKETRIYLEAKDKYWQKVDQALIRKRKNLKDVKHIIMDLMSTLKKMLISTILPQNLTIRLRIGRELDLKQISSEIDSNVFHFEKYVTFVLDTLALLCCPIRDQEIVEIREMITEKVPFSRQVKRLIDLMEEINLDMANFILSQSRPHILQNCVTFERTQFAKYIEGQYKMGKDPIKFTRQWIKSHCQFGRGFKETMAYAFLQFMEQDDDDINWPETLSLDWFRFSPIRQEVLRVSVVGAVAASVYDLTVSFMISKENVQNFEDGQVLLMKNLRLLSKLREDLNHLIEYEDVAKVDLLQKALLECSVSALKIVDKYLISEKCEGLTYGQKDMITGSIKALIDKNHPNRLLYSRRIREWLVQVILKEGKGILQAPPNLHVIGPLILKPITELCHIINYNRSLFDVVYQEIFLGKCPRPSFYPNTHGQTKAIILDANNPNQYDSHEMDDGIAHLLKNLKNFKDRTMVYRRSRVTPNIQPMYNFDGTLIKAPEQEDIGTQTVRSPLEQKRYEEYILKNEPTLDVDYDGIYNISDPNWMFDQTSEQLIRIMERDNIIKANKLRRIKKQIQENILRKRIEKNLPVFEKVWREEVGYLQMEYCRLERILKKGPVELPENARDEFRPKRVFKGTCELKSNPEVKGKGMCRPKCNEKGERVIYSRNRGASFETKIPAKLQNVEYDFSRFKPDSAEEQEIHGYVEKVYNYY